MATSSSPEIEGIRKTLSEIQRLAGTVAEADRQRSQHAPQSPQSAVLVPLSLYRGDSGGALAKHAAVVPAPPLETAPAPALPRLALIGAASGALFVAGMALYLFGSSHPPAEQGTRRPELSVGRTDARTDSRNAVNAKASVGAGTTVAAVAAAPKSAEAAKTPPEQATVAALDPAGPRAVLAPSTTPARDSAGSEPGNPAWQSTNLTVTSLVAMGRIAEAREMLFQAHPETDPDAAWALARTFDPRYVARISGSDAAPDVEQATKWYRTWHALALEKGRISGDVSVERILRGMN